MKMKQTMPDNNDLAETGYDNNQPFCLYYLYKMADVHSTKTRSYNMSQIKATNTKPELVVRKFLHANSFRYRLHGANSPDTHTVIPGLTRNHSLTVCHSACPDEYRGNVVPVPDSFREGISNQICQLKY